MTAVDLWSEAEHARDYLARRKDLPHRLDGYAALLEFLPAAPRRILDLGTGDGELLARVRRRAPRRGGRRGRLLGRDARSGACPLRRRRRGDRRDARSRRHAPRVRGAPSTPSCRPSPSITSTTPASAPLYGEVYERLAPGGVFCNLEHVASPTPELHEAFLQALGSSIERDDPSNKLLDVATQLAWLRAIGFEQVDCHWKWREMALLAGVRPA